MPHQVDAVAKLLPPRVGAMFMDMGTGKSRTLIELAKLRAGKWDKLFWFCPVSLKDTVAAQLREHTDLPPEAVYVWDDRTGRREVPRSARIHVAGIETLSQSDRAVAAYNDLVTPESFVAVDESTYIKGPMAKRTQRLTYMSERGRYRAILTGTPLTQGAVDLYSQMRFLSPKILGYSSFWSFARNHLEFEERRGLDGRRRRTGRIVRCHNEDYLAARIAPYTYQVRKDECLTLPDKLYETRYCRMSGRQRELYERAKEEILLTTSYDDWSSIRIFQVFTALQSIVCGFWNRTDHDSGEANLIEVESPRLALLRDTLAEIPPNEKIIIWCKYRYAGRQIVDMLAADHGTEVVAVFNGGLSERQRDRELDRWRNEARFLVATQSAGGHGLTLNEAAYVVFYADSFKFAERIQAEDRNHRIGQTRRPVYLSLRCLDSIDGRIAAAHSRKGNTLEEFQQRVESYRRDGLKDRIRELVMAL